MLNRRYVKLGCYKGQVALRIHDNQPARWVLVGAFSVIAKLQYYRMIVSRSWDTDGLRNSPLSSP